MARLSCLVLCLTLVACDDNGGADAGPPGVDLEFTATPDPAELSDCLSTLVPAGQVRAKHIVCADELIDDSLAMGQIGDLILENARARFVIRRGEGAASIIGAPAGGLIDASMIGGPDLLKEVLPLFDLVSMGPTAIEVVDAGGDDEARVRVLFDDAPIAFIETVIPGLGRAVRLRGALDYVLRADDDFLTIEIQMTTEEGVVSSSADIGVVGLLGGGELFQPGQGVLDDDNLGGDGVTMISERPSGAMALSMLTEAGSVTHIETIHLMRAAPRVSLSQGETVTVRVRVGVGETGAHALAAALEPNDVEHTLTLTGTPGERVLIEAPDGTPELRSTFDRAGEVVVSLPAGDHSITAGFAHYFEAAPMSITLSGDQTVAVPPAPRANVTFAALVDGAPDVRVRVTVQDDTGEELERIVVRGNTLHLLPPRAVRITISHGLEYDSFTTDLSLTDASVERLEPDLLRAIDTDGWVSVDLHLHSDLSADSVHPIEDAVRMLDSEGVQVAAATDHDFLTDYAEVGRRAGVDTMLLVPGVESSTTTFGHVGGYPLIPDPAQNAHGAPVWFGLTPVELFDAIRARGDASLGGALVQINHPRLGDASFFGTLQLDRDTGRATLDPTLLDWPAATDLNDFSFDVLEIFNGCCRGGDEESFLDYLALYTAGRRFTMVGNSDSHNAERPPGTPRTFVRVPDETSFTWQDIAASLRAGTATVAGAVFVTASLDGPVAGDDVPVRVVVQAPPWVEVDRLRVFAGRTAAIDMPIAASSDAVRFDQVIDVPLSGHDFVLVRVDGPTAPEPLQRFPALGVTNPLPVP